MCFFVVRVNKKVYYILIFQIEVAGDCTMERNLSSWKLENDEHAHEETYPNHKCDGCGGEFQRPLLATVTSNEVVQRYYACPRCLTQVREERRRQNQGSSDTQFSIRDAVKPAAKLDDNVKCDHFFGYLRKRDKNSPIPEDCLTCEKMIECMVY
jgi:DNA-directed RNA polymerase subunit RPC12/RpoP